MEQQDAAFKKELDKLKKASVPANKAALAAGVAAVGAERARETEVLQLRQRLKKAEELGGHSVRLTRRRRPSGVRRPTKA